MAALTLSGLATMAVYFLFTGGLAGRWVDIEKAAPVPPRFLVDINAADWPELTQLPEVGEVLARRIVESRLREGPFETVDDLRRVRGIGPRTMELVRPYVVVAVPLERGPLPGLAD